MPEPEPRPREPEGKRGPKPRGLNVKREKFALAYARCGRTVQAALEAGYAPRSARTQGSDLLKIPAVKARVVELRREIREEAKVDEALVLQELADLLRVDVLELFDDDGSVRKLRDMSAEARRLIAGLEVKRDRGGDTIVKIKLLDRLKVIELMGRHKVVDAWKNADQIVNIPTLVIRNYTGRPIPGLPNPEEEDR